MKRNLSNDNSRIENKKKKTGHFIILPNETVNEILQWIPSLSIIDYSRVSKECYEVINFHYHDMELGLNEVQWHIFCEKEREIYPWIRSLKLYNRFNHKSIQISKLEPFPNLSQLSLHRFNLGVREIEYLRDRMRVLSFDSCNVSIGSLLILSTSDILESLSLKQDIKDFEPFIGKFNCIDYIEIHTHRYSEELINFLGSIRKGVSLVTKDSSLLENISLI